MLPVHVRRCERQHVQELPLVQIGVKVSKEPSLTNAAWRTKGCLLGNTIWSHSDGNRKVVSQTFDLPLRFATVRSNGCAFQNQYQD
jgi:hypothetical protein